MSDSERVAMVQGWLKDWEAERNQKQAEKERRQAEVIRRRQLARKKRLEEIEEFLSVSLGTTGLFLWMAILILGWG